MNTQSHMLMGAVLYGRSDPRLLRASMVGGLIPDVPMILIFGTLKEAGFSDRAIFGRLFFENWWQIANAIGHSFLLWGGLVGLAFWLRKRDAWAGAGALLALSAAALTHSVVDFLCHRDDAHMHFWPLSRWKFVSPVSYYDPAHYGTYFAIFEAVLGLAMAAILIRRIRNGWGRLFILLLALPYLAVPAYFAFHRSFG